MRPMAQPRHPTCPPITSATCASLMCVQGPSYRYQTYERPRHSVKCDRHHRAFADEHVRVLPQAHLPHAGACQMKIKVASGVLAIIATFTGMPVARTEERLPPSELYPCEVVLHELIAQLRGLRAEAKRTSASIHRANDEQDQLAAKELALELAAWDETIRLATKKFERCP